MTVLDFLANSFREGGWAITNYPPIKRGESRRSQLVDTDGIALIDPPYKRRPEALVQLFVEKRLLGVVLAVPKNPNQAEWLVGRASYVYPTTLPSWMIYNKLPLVYFANDDELWLINSAESTGIERMTQVHSLEATRTLIDGHRGRRVTRLQPVIRQSPCVCASGWVTTRTGGSWEAAGECRYCRDRRESGSPW